MVLLCQKCSAGINILNSLLSNILHALFCVDLDLIVVCFQNCISTGAGGEMGSYYKSVIYYHEDKPKWFETVKVGDTETCT